MPTYTKSRLLRSEQLRRTYPDPGYIPGWNLLWRLVSGLSISLDIQNLMAHFSVHEQITRLVCVEGWSAVAWWACLRFDDLFAPIHRCSPAKWARVESSVNLDASGNPDPYFISIDMATAGHPRRCSPHDSRCTPYRGSWSTASSAGGHETWFEEREGHYQDFVCRGGAERLLGSSVDIPATTESSAFQHSRLL